MTATNGVRQFVNEAGAAIVNANQPEKTSPALDRVEATDRRAAMIRLAKGAAYVAPVTLALLSMTEPAAASA